jgi:hypothetical protein
MRKFLEGAAVGAGLLAASAGLTAHADGNDDWGSGGRGIKRVLLVSIDGMHAVDPSSYCPPVAGRLYARYNARLSADQRCE